MVDLQWFRHKEFGFWLARATAVDTLLESVPKRLLARDWVSAVVSTTLRQEMLGIIPMWDEVHTINTEFHTITYR
jgi:hypothetical protein